MYLEHFGYSRRPFDIKPSAELYFPSKSHSIGLSVLEYALFNDAPFCLLSGEVGSGKSTLVELLLQRAPERCEILVIQTTHAMFGDIATMLGYAIGIDELGTDRFPLLQKALMAYHERGRRPILVVDEAQNLSLADLEAIRLITNLVHRGLPLVQVLLVGQVELREALKRPELRQLVQRIAADYHLEGLDVVAVREYIHHRERIAGVPTSRFDADAVASIATASSGIPRVINALCDMALVYAFSDDAAMVTGAQVDQVVREKQAGGLFWAGAGDTAEPLAVVAEPATDARVNDG